MESRKFLAFLCAAALLSCAGCGKSAESTTAEVDGTTISSENTDKAVTTTTTKKTTTKASTTKKTTTSGSSTTTKAGTTVAANGNNGQNNSAGNNSSGNSNRNSNNNSNSNSNGTSGNTGNSGNNANSGGNSAGNSNGNTNSNNNNSNSNNNTQNTAQDESSVSDAISVTLNGNSASTSNSGAVSISGSVITITQGGKYNITGDLNDGQIIVNASKEEKVDLYFDGVGITCSSSAPLYVLSADTCTLHLVDGSSNYVVDSASNALSACIFSKDDLTIKGGGSLSVTGAKKHGIKSSNDVKIKNGNLTISAVSTGVYGEDSVQISGGNTVITSCKDGIKASNETETDKGFIQMEDGYVDIQNAQGNGLEAITGVTITAGVVNVHSTKKAVNCDYQSINTGCLVTY